MFAECRFEVIYEMFHILNCGFLKSNRLWSLISYELWSLKSNKLWSLMSYDQISYDVIANVMGSMVLFRPVKLLQHDTSLAIIQVYGVSFVNCQNARWFIQYLHLINSPLRQISYKKNLNTCRKLMLKINWGGNLQVSFAGHRSLFY